MVPILVALVCALALTSADQGNDGIMFQMPCPIFECMYTRKCASGQYEQQYAYIGGVKCPSCRICKETPNTKPVRQIIDMGGSMCPIVNCEAHHCEVGRHTRSYFYSHGRQCTGCPTCINIPRINLRTLQGLGGCPSPTCSSTNKCKSNLVTSYFTFRGRECTGCPACAGEVDP